MHIRLAEILTELERTRARLLDTVAGADATRLTAEPPPGKWSSAEVLDHLANVEKSIAGLIGRVIERAGDTLEKETSEESVLGRFDSSVARDRTRRIEAPESIHPRAGVTVDDARAALDASRQMLMQALDRADGFALENLSFPHRIFGTLDLYQWLLFLDAHENRHREQIAELVEES
jgi:uncharacterized damage-inducible protein DinB